MVLGELLSIQLGHRDQHIQIHHQLQHLFPLAEPRPLIKTRGWNFWLLHEKLDLLLTINVKVAVGTEHKDIAKFIALRR